MAHYYFRRVYLIHHVFTYFIVFLTLLIFSCVVRKETWYGFNFFYTLSRLTLLPKLMASLEK